MNPPEIDPALQKLFDRDEKLKQQLDNPWEDQIDLAHARPVQLGLTPVYADKMGRLWIYADERNSDEMHMIFDPNWLHPSKRWAGSRLDTRRLPAKEK